MLSTDYLAGSEVRLTLVSRCSAASPLAVLEGPGMVDRDHVAVGEASLADRRHPPVLLVHILSSTHRHL